MASTTRNAKSSAFDSSMDNTSSTLKRHPKMELNKNDLLRLLSYLEGELQARDVTIAALKAEKAKQLLYQAKYGRFGLSDPFTALQRDSDCQKDNTFDEAAIKAMYDNQLAQLENLIATQQQAQQRMREQLAAVEKRYHKVCAELEDEKRKHAQDQAQGDDVTYMLEKERERLKQEVEFEKGKAKRMEKEASKTSGVLEEERGQAVRHKQVAIMLIKERKKIMEKLLVLQHENMELTKAIAEQQQCTKSIADNLTSESKKTHHMEASMEKHINEFDVEREQLKMRLKREERLNQELATEVERLRGQVENLQRQAGVFGMPGGGEGPQSIEIRSTSRLSEPRSVSPGSQRSLSPGGSSQRSVSPQACAKVTSMPVNIVTTGAKAFKSTPPSTPPEVRKIPVTHVPPDPADRVRYGTSPDSSVKRAIMQFDTSPTKTEKPLVVAAGDKAAAAAPTLYTSNPGSTTVFTTPSGTRISLTTGPSPTTPRKPVGVGRGTPPPLPPNKPAYVPQLQNTPVARKDYPANAGASGRAGTPTLASQSHPAGANGAKPQPPTKFITITKDKITISGPPTNSVSSATGVVGGAASRGLSPGGANSISGNDPNVRKPTQVCLNIK